MRADVNPIESRPFKPRFWKVEESPGIILWEVKDLDLDLFLLLSESTLTTRLTNNWVGKATSDHTPKEKCELIQICVLLGVCGGWVWNFLFYFF